MSILLLVEDLNQEHVENNLVRLLDAVTHYFPNGTQVGQDYLLLVLTELIEKRQARQIYDFISGLTSFHSPLGECAVVTLRCALLHKININKAQCGSVEDELLIAKSLINTGETKYQNDQYHIHAELLEESLTAARRIKSSPCYPLLFTTILHETHVLQKMNEAEAEPECDNFKDRRIKLMKELLSLLESFRNNKIPLDKFYRALKKHSQKTRVIPHTSTVGAAFGFFFGKLTSTAKLSYDYLDVVSKLNDSKEPARVRLV